ncbi:hypothetical protein [Dactylosporangium sp. CA-092794]|uniref:hypothetical protein n=1 Tax=Dactylosporangium sp. CA-092794 TaxID=3239929 RepID=UPI003D90333A
MVNSPDESALVTEFLDRFLGFEDGVISRISIVLPRGDRGGRRIELEIQALDRKAPAEEGPGGRLFGWKLVRIFMHGIEEYSLGETIEYPLQVLSDGLKIGFLGDRFLLDLDPGPDEWSSLAIQDLSTSYSKQYIVARGFSFEVADGPFI